MPDGGLPKLGAPARKAQGGVKRHLRRALRALVFLLVGVELLYLVGVNLFLSLGGLDLLFASTNSIKADFRRAWTFFPGRVEVRDLRIVFQDKNLQWSLDLPRGHLVLRLSELPGRTFHAASVQGDG